MKLTAANSSPFRGLGGGCFKFLNLILLAQNIIDIIIAIRHAGFFVGINLKSFLLACGYNADHLFYQVNFHLCMMIGKYRVEYFLQESIAYLYRQQAVVQRV